MTNAEYADRAFSRQQAKATGAITHQGNNSCNSKHRTNMRRNRIIALISRCELDLTDDVILIATAFV